MHGETLKLFNLQLHGFYVLTKNNILILYDTNFYASFSSVKQTLHFPFLRIFLSRCP